jgi:hypothetical protein
MVSEKIAASAEAQVAAATALMKGQSAKTALTRAATPYRRRARANHKRLTKSSAGLRSFAHGPKLDSLQCASLLPSGRERARPWTRCLDDVSTEDCAMTSKFTLAAAALAASVALIAAPAAYAQHHGGWHGGGWHHGGGWGGAAAGFAAGALIGGALGAAASGPYYGYGYGPGYYGYDYGYAPGPVVVEGSSGGAEAYCEQRFRSYDPASGTYLGYDGLRHPCP